MGDPFAVSRIALSCHKLKLVITVSKVQALDFSYFYASEYYGVPTVAMYVIQLYGLPVSSSFLSALCVHCITIIMSCCDNTPSEISHCQSETKHTPKEKCISFPYQKNMYCLADAHFLMVSVIARVTNIQVLMHWTEPTC